MFKPNDIHEFCFSSIKEVAPSIENGALSPMELTQAMLERIENIDSELHCFNAVTAELALSQADAAEKEIMQGLYRGPLHGIPIALKDLFETKGIKTTCSSKVLADWVPAKNATVVEKLESAGAILLGKLNMTEFALYGYNPQLDVPVNPWNPNHWAGVSSSGPAAATAAHLAFATLGTDTGGSIRFPCAANGVVGIKPTYGRVSGYGTFPLAHTLDHIGPICKTVTDCGIMLNTIAGHDVNDPRTLTDVNVNYLENIDDRVSGLKIGIDESYIVENSEPIVSEAVLKAAEHLKSMGATLVQVDVGGITEISPYWEMITAVEAAIAHKDHFPERADQYGPIFRNLLESAHTYNDEDVAKGYLLAKQIKSEFQKAIADVDMLLCPSMPVLPPTLQEVPPYDIMPSEASIPLLCYTVPFNFTGNPTISLPCGFTDKNLPISLQLVGQLDGEPRIIQAAFAYEQSTSWHKQMAPAAHSPDQ